MALELARHRIRVNALLPGYVVTDLNRDFLASEAGEKLRARIPSRRFGELTDLDGPLLLLASDAGAAMSGRDRGGGWRPPGEFAVTRRSRRRRRWPRYLRAQGLADTQRSQVSPLSGGQSNPTFRVAPATRRYVLRKKPAGQLLASAHAIDREYRVMQALQGTRCARAADAGLLRGRVRCWARRST